MRRKYPLAGSEFHVAQRDALELGDINPGETGDLKEEIGAARHRFRDCSTAASAVGHQPSAISDQPSAISRQPSVINRQSPSPISNLLSPVCRRPHRPLTTDHCALSTAIIRAPEETWPSA